MSKALKPVVTIQLPKDGKHPGRYETLLRGVAEDGNVETLRKLVTAMCRSHKTYEIGDKRRGTFGTERPAKRAPVRRPDDESAEPQELHAG